MNAMGCCVVVGLFTPVQKQPQGSHVGQEKPVEGSLVESLEGVDWVQKGANALATSWG